MKPGNHENAVSVACALLVHLLKLKLPTASLGELLAEARRRLEPAFRDATTGKIQHHLEKSFYPDVIAQHVHAFSGDSPAELRVAIVGTVRSTT